MRQLDCGHTEELMIVREVLAKVGNCDLVEQVTDEQVRSYFSLKATMARLFRSFFCPNAFLRTVKFSS